MKKRILKKISDTLKSSPRSGRTVAVSIMILMVIKLFVVSYIYGGQLTGSRFLHTFFNYLGFIGSDFMVLGIVLFFVFLNLFFRSKWLKIIGNTISAILLLLFFIDILTIFYFQARLSVLDLYSFFSISNGGYFFAYIAVITSIFFACFIFLFAFVQKKFSWTKKRNKQLSLAIRFFMFSIFFSFLNFLSSSNQDIQENVVFLNLREISNSIGENSNFAYLKNIKLSKNYESYFKNIKGQNKKLDVILVFAESFSTVDSTRAGGLYDNFPLFDKIQSEGVTYTNFMANGCTSETAHIALLQGVEPRQNPIERPGQSYYQYANYTESLTDFFNDLGYQTTFLSTAPLDFLDQRDYIMGLDFKTIIGEEAFKNETKYVFDAAPDHILYNKALDLVQSGIKSKEPLFLTMQTVSSHKPYDTPMGSSTTEMFKYVDRNIYAFYTKLKNIGFFDNGLLVIVGDHRKMESIPTAEFKKYGLTSHSRALATVIGKDIQSGQIDDNIIQHMDIFYSLKYLLGSGNILVNKDFNNIFNPLQENRDRGVRFCRFSEKYYTVLKKNNEAYTLRAGMDGYIQDYITAYKKFQYQNLIGNGFDSDYFDNFKPRSGNNNDYIIISHRGGDPLVQVGNSIKGFKIAKENRANGLEFDVSLTKDGYNVVYHGPSLNNTQCDKKQNIYDYNLKDLQSKCKLKNGETIMTLEESLTQIKGWFDYYFIEIKVYDPNKAEEQTLDIINTVNRLGMQDKVIFTSYDKVANYIIGSYKGINAAWDTYNSGNINIVGKFPHKYFMMPYDLINEEVVKIAQMSDKNVVVYTVNDKEGFDRIYDMGIKMIMTDNVPLIKKLIKEKSIQSYTGTVK